MATGEKNRIGIVLAIVAGLLAMGITFVFLNKLRTQATPASAGTSGKYATRTVLAAARDLPAGHLLEPSGDLTTIQIPVGGDIEKFAKLCVDTTYLPQLVGRRLSVPLPETTPLFYSHLLDTQSIDDKFTSGVLKTITLARENFFSSHLTPGDHVDILATHAKPAPPKTPDQPTSAGSGNNSGGVDISGIMAAAMAPLLASSASDNQEMETITVLEDVEVFMIGSLLDGNRRQLGLTAPEGDSSEITFRLSKESAVLLTNYQNSGGNTLSLLLRPRKQTEN